MLVAWVPKWALPRAVGWEAAPLTESPSTSLSLRPSRFRLSHVLPAGLLRGRVSSYTNGSLAWRVGASLATQLFAFFLSPGKTNPTRQQRLEGLEGLEKGKGKW